MHISELAVDLFEDVVELLANFVLWGRGRNQLHVSDLVHYTAWLAEALLNEAHRNLLFVLAAVKNDADAALVEADNHLHHADGLVEWAVVVMLREGVLLQELILDDLGSLENGLLIFGERVSADQLDDFSEFIFVLENLTNGLSEAHELWVDLGVVV